MKDSTVVVSGIKPTGRVHLGNYLGMIRPVLRLAAQHEAYVFVADGHALTTVEDPAELARTSRELTAVLLALGLDPARTVLYRQSELPEVFELARILACSTPKGALNRAPAYKAAVAANRAAGRQADEGVSTGLFTYPVLMAADILGMAGAAVPVGADQAQHLEVTRDVAIAFNRTYGAVLTVPEAVVDQDVAVIPGTDGRKMSKSYDNVIPMMAAPKEMGRLVRTMVTDSRRPEEPKDPATCSLYGLYRHLVASEQVRALAERYTAGGVGYGEVKALLTDALVATFSAARERHRPLIADSAGLDAVLSEGAERARVRGPRCAGAGPLRPGTGLVSGAPGEPDYAFGDSDAAAERLRMLGEAFAPPSRSLLRHLVGHPIGLAVDLGCGPGHTTRLLAEELQPAEIIGLDRSESFLARARARHVNARWYLHDVAEVPFPEGPADLIYARLALAHLPRPDEALADWLGQLQPGGCLVLEEDEDIVTDVDSLARYEAMSSDLVRARGGDLYIGRKLAGRDWGGANTILDRSWHQRLAASLVARLFGMNFRVWRHEPHVTQHHSEAELSQLADELETLAQSSIADQVDFVIRQVIVKTRQSLSAGPRPVTGVHSWYP